MGSGIDVHPLNRGRIRADPNFARDGAEDLLIAGDAAFLETIQGPSL